MTHTLELTTEELQELHLILVVRKGQIREELQNVLVKQQGMQGQGLLIESLNRQLERVAPLVYQVQSMVREHHAKV